MRKLPKSFFWIDQQVVRGGAWTKLSPQARLAYVSIAASCDREGLSIWSRSKLMEIAGIADPEGWGGYLAELAELKLVELLPDHVPQAVRLLSFESAPSEPTATPQKPVATQSPATPIVIHTHTSIHLSNDKISLPHADASNSS